MAVWRFVRHLTDTFDLCVKHASKIRQLRSSKQATKGGQLHCRPPHQEGTMPGYMLPGVQRDSRSQTPRLGRISDLLQRGPK